MQLASLSTLILAMIAWMKAGLAITSVATKTPSRLNGALAALSIRTRMIAR